MRMDIEVKKLRILGNHRKSRIELMMKGIRGKEIEMMVVRMGEVEDNGRVGRW